MTKFKFSATVSNGAVKSTELNLKFGGKNRHGQKLNAWRLAGYKIQIDDLDEEVDGDLLHKTQLAYQNLNAGSLLAIDDLDEIVTLAEQEAIPTVGTNAGTGLQNSRNTRGDEIRQQGKLYLDGRDFINIYIVKEKFWVNHLNGGQDADEVFHCILDGRYVHLPQKEIDALKQGATLT